MSGEELRTDILNFSNEKVYLSDENARREVEYENSTLTGSVFDFSQTENTNKLVKIEEIDENNLVPLRSIEEHKEEKGFFGKIFSAIANFFKNIFNKKEEIPDVDLENNESDIENNDISVNLVPMEKTEAGKNRVNGLIDQDFNQGSLHDCMLIASVYSLSSTEEGEKLIQDAISTNYSDSGKIESYDIYFKGLDKTYNITTDELKEAEELKAKYNGEEGQYYFSSGDDDILLFELAYLKAYNDIEKEKSKSSIWEYEDPVKQALYGVDEEQFLYGFVGTENVNHKHFVAEKYEQEQIEEYKPQILEIFETQTSFLFEEVTLSDNNKHNINGFEFNREDVYKIEQKPSENEDGTITIVNEKTGEKLTINADYLAKVFAGTLLPDNKIKLEEDMYNYAVEADFAVFGCTTKTDVVDIDGNTKTISGGHAYGVREITTDYITLVNPADSTDIITISKNEYLKYYKNFQLTSANFS